MRIGESYKNKTRYEVRRNRQWSLGNDIIAHTIISSLMYVISLFINQRRRPMNEEYLNEIKQMGEDVEVVVKKVIRLETLLSSHSSRIEDLEHRNKKVERELNAMIVKYYEQDASSNEKEAAWTDA